MRCPECGLINPKSAVVCDCGLVLSAEAGPGTVAAAQEAAAQVRAERAAQEAENQRVNDAVRGRVSAARSLLRLFRLFG